MFYDNKKIIYTVLLISALLISFFFGKNVGNGSTFSKKSLVQNVTENKNYNSQLDVKGVNYSLSYTVNNAYFIDKDTMNFNIDLQNNNNVNNIKVIVKDQNNNVVNTQSNASNDPNSLNYTATLTNDIKKINITVYPLNTDMANDKNLDLTTVPYQNSVLDLSLIKKQQIDSLQN